MLFSFSSAIDPLFCQPHEEQPVHKEGGRDHPQTPQLSQHAARRCPVTRALPTPGVFNGI